MSPAAAESPFVGLDETTLANGSHSLEPGQLGRPAGQADAAHAGADGSRTDKHDPPPIRRDGVDLAAQRFDAGRIEQAVGPSEHARAHFDDDELRGG